MNNNEQKEKITIAYLMNPDPVFFNELDHKLIAALKEKGADVVQVNLSEIHIRFTADGVKYFNNETEIHPDGLLCYGYMR
jgi:hypothetical protein